MAADSGGGNMLLAQPPILEYFTGEMDYLVLSLTTDKTSEETATMPATLEPDKPDAQELLSTTEIEHEPKPDDPDKPDVQEVLSTTDLEPDKPDAQELLSITELEPEPKSIKDYSHQTSRYPYGSTYPDIIKYDNPNEFHEPIKYD
jgi:hypothetical protein